MEFKQTFDTPKEHTPGTNTCEFIVLHHTGTGHDTIAGVLAGLNKRDDFASCHYVTDENGDRYKSGKDSDILWHAGVSEWKDVLTGKVYKDLNKYSIGIEIVGPVDGGFTDAQRQSVKELVKELCKKYGIPKERVLRHKDIAPKRKTDVADSFWNVKFKTYEEFVNDIFSNPLPTMAKKTKYSDILAAVVKETGYVPVFEKHEGDFPITEQETKELIDIALARISQRFKK